MHQNGQNQGEKIIRLNPPEGQQSEYFYYVLFTNSAGNEIRGWAGNKYLSPKGNENGQAEAAAYNDDVLYSSNPYFVESARAQGKKAELVEDSNMFSSDPRFDENGKATGNYSPDSSDPRFDESGKATGNYSSYGQE